MPEAAVVRAAGARCFALLAVVVDMPRRFGENAVMPNLSGVPGPAVAAAIVPLAVDLASRRRPAARARLAARPRPSIAPARFIDIEGLRRPVSRQGVHA
jgi:hypothetical protein